MRYIILTCLTLTFILTAFRPLQEFTVKGIIMDDQNGLPVSGATVQVKGTRKRQQLRTGRPLLHYSFRFIRHIGIYGDRL